MEAPPPYSPPARRKPNTALIVVLILGGIALACLVMIGIAVFLGWGTFRGTVQPIAECAIGFEDARKAVLAYAEENDGVLPNAETWEDDVRPFFQQVLEREGSRGPFSSFPIEGPWGCSIGEGARSGVAFNSELSGRKLAEIEDQRGTILLYEARQAGRNLNGPFETLPRDESPRIFGEPRGWLRLPIRGETQGLEGATSGAGAFPLPESETSP